MWGPHDLVLQGGEDLRRPGPEELAGNALAELDRLSHRGGAVRPEHTIPLRRTDQGREVQPPSLDPGVAGDRDLAAALEPRQEGALGRDRGARRRVLQPRAESDGRGVV